MSNNKISYVEFPARDIGATKAFFTAAFGWNFVDYGPDYASFADQGIDGGFYRSDMASSADAGGALVILYSDALEEAQTRVERAGGVILKPIFSFPGGRRFHFAEPSGNELAVWSDTGG
jgi:predicted enzyme related to lactoylglutathione lyase